MLPFAFVVLSLSGSDSQFQTVDLRTVQTVAELPERGKPHWTFQDLDRIRDLAEAGALADPELAPREGLPAGLTQAGFQVHESAFVDRGAPPPIPQTRAELPGNGYPRGATLFLNFAGGELLNRSPDNSALGHSQLARQGNYPPYTGGESRALASIQAIEADVAKYNIRVLYDRRPDDIVPYTMVMIGGTWRDTNIDQAAGGVAPGADCGALGQRHVVYTFASGALPSTNVANTSSQEAGHAWGLDHTTNCSSVMAYCGGGDQHFSTTCDPLCGKACGGAPSRCERIHDEYCGEGSGRQNEDAELMALFGPRTPDTEPPFARIVSPNDGAVFAAGTDFEFRVEVDDDREGFGWGFEIKKDGEFIPEVTGPRFDQDLGLNFDGAPEGEYELSVIVMDHADHVTKQTVTVEVRADVEPGGTTGGEPNEGGQDDGATGGLDGGDGDEGDAEDDGGTEGGPSAEGGGCTAAPPTPWALGLPLWLVWRRMRGARFSQSREA